MKSRKTPGATEQSSKRDTASKKENRRGRKLSEYGKQLEEKQKGMPDTNRATQPTLFQPPKTRESLSNDIWRACDILRRDNNCGGIMEYVEHLSWLLFLRFLGAQEEVWEAEAALADHPYEHILDGDLRWNG